MKGFRVPKEKAQIVKEYLLAHGLLDRAKHLVIGKNSITFPITQEKTISHVFPFGKFVVARFPASKQKKESFQEALKKILSPEEEHMLSGFDVIGKVAIVEISPELRKKEKMIANSIMATHPHIETVVKKKNIHTGLYRTQQFVHLAGKRELETIHRENAVQIKLHLSKVYFSPRLAEERKRIASLVKPNERVLVLFSGVGVYPLVIARNSPAAWVYGIELNPVAHQYAEENKALNNLQNVTFLHGDARNVKKLLAPYAKCVDRIIMPLPKNAGDFLKSALSVAKKGTTFYFYEFFPEKEIPQAPRKKIKALCKKHHVFCRILSVVKCGQYAPYVARVCIDFIIS